MRKQNSEVEYVTERTASNGAASVDGIAEKLQIGKRQLEGKFTAAVGLSPKMFAGILRFQKALQLIENHEFDNFTKTACDGGFYDQAHFIKNFEYFTGLNPKKYF